MDSTSIDEREERMNTGGEVMQTMVVLPEGRTADCGVPVRPMSQQREHSLTNALVVLPLAALLGAMLALAALASVAPSPSHGPAAPAEKVEIEMPSAWEMDSAGTYALRLGPLPTR